MRAVMTRRTMWLSILGGLTAGQAAMIILRATRVIGWPWLLILTPVLVVLGVAGLILVCWFAGLYEMGEG